MIENIPLDFSLTTRYFFKNETTTFMNQSNLISNEITTKTINVWCCQVLVDPKIVGS